MRISCLVISSFCLFLSQTTLAKPPTQLYNLIDALGEHQEGTSGFRDAEAALKAAIKSKEPCKFIGNFRHSLFPPLHYALTSTRTGRVFLRYFIARAEQLNREDYTEFAQFIELANLPLRNRPLGPGPNARAVIASPENGFWHMLAQYWNELNEDDRLLLRQFHELTRGLIPIDAPNAFEQTALNIAQRGNHNPAVAAFLIELGANQDLQGFPAPAQRARDLMQAREAQLLGGNLLGVMGGSL